MLTQKLRPYVSAAPALKDKLGYLELLERLVDDEHKSRDNKGLQKRLRSARFSVVKNPRRLRLGVPTQA